MVLVVKVFMVKNSMMKDFNLNILKEAIYLWLMQDQIQTHLNFLLLLMNVHG